MRHGTRRSPRHALRLPTPAPGHTGPKPDAPAPARSHGANPFDHAIQTASRLACPPRGVDHDTSTKTPSPLDSWQTKARFRTRLAALLALPSNLALAQGGNLQPVQSTLQQLIQVLTGPIATSLAILAVIALGMLAGSDG